MFYGNPENIDKFFKTNPLSGNIIDKINHLVNMFVIFPFSCSAHEEFLRNMFRQKTVNILSYSWCRSINRILAGKITYDGNDRVKILAMDYYKKHKSHK